MKFQFGFDTAFHGDGENHDPALVRNFLSQRKWVMLCGTSVALISNNFVSLHGKWLFFATHVDFSSVGLLRTISGTGILFGLYMLFSRFPFIQKFEDLQRNAYTELKLEKQSSVSEEIKMLDEQRVEIEERLGETEIEYSSLAKSLNSAVTNSRTLMMYLDVLKLHPAGETIPASDDVIQIMKSKGVPSSIFDQGFQLEEILQVNSVIESEIKSLNNELNSIRSLRAQIRDNQSALTDRETALQTRLTELARRDEELWKKFYTERLIATHLSLLPAFLSFFYCVYYLLYESFQ